MTTVSEIMMKKVITVKKNESLQTVCKLLVSQRLSGVPVINEKGNLVGFISERDIIQAAVSKDLRRTKVSDVMTRNVLAVEENAPIDQLSRIFTDKPYRYIPVTKADKLVGVVSRKDVINKLLGQYY